MRTRILSGVLVVLGFAFALTLPAAGAQAATAVSEAPVSIPAGQQIVDNANALGSAQTEVQTALTKLRNDRGFILYVVFVNSFDGMTPDSWGQQVIAQKNASSRFEALMAVATDTRQYSFLTANNSGITQSQKSNIVKAMGAQLSNSNWSQAAIDTANSLNDAAGGGAGNPPNPTGGIVGTAIFLVLVAGAVVAFVVLRRRRKEQAAVATASGYSPTGAQLDPMAGTSVEDLRTKAGSMLIAADDAIKSSDQEISFAQAAYGDEAVKPFQAALLEAKGHLTESFKLQQQLDDSIPDTIEQQRAWYSEIIRRSEAANQALAEQKQSFDSLRELEKTAPQALANVSAGAQKIRAQLQSVQATLSDLQSRYAESATTTIKDNIAQAQERLAFVEAASQNASQKISEQDAAAAAIAVRAAEEALHQATLLEDAIGKVSTDLQNAAKNLPSAVAEAQTDLAQAKAMVAAGQNSQVAGQVAAAESVIIQVQSQMNAGKVDPIALLQQVETAHTNLDQLLSGIRDQQQQAQRAQASLQQAIMNAQAQISSAQDYIAARRGGVGAEARTRVAEAQRNLDYALSIQRTDPVSALTYANQAIALAQQATQLAQSDVDGFGLANSGYGGGYGYRGGGGAGGSFGAGLGGAILGGILGGMLSGGSHGNNSNWGGGGFGGWSSGDSGGGDSGGFSGDSGNF